ncbi:hypothetical protein [Hoeflea olei]|uniref:hypothetical protein n=1 Tax=Hoeflea olei TaxID=1480615 RepID=UPI0011128E63|nr:hypothetical protein [Hoeflea olei]
MIEFVLLFALGFLAAALVALIVAPIIHRRVVTLTERRIRASVPLSTAEIRAEKDMARAAFAAENARLSIDLKSNRDLLAGSVARNERLSNELVTLRAEKLATETTLEEREASIRELNAELAERDIRITTLTGHFNDATRLAEARKLEMAKRDDQINRLGTEIEELRIDRATLDTEAENFKAQIRDLREERAALRETLKETEAANRDLENRLKSNSERLAQTEQKLARTITALTDRENALERRVAEVERFRQKNRELSDQLRGVRSGSRSATDTARAAQEAAALADMDDDLTPAPAGEEPRGHGSDDEVTAATEEPRTEPAAPAPVAQPAPPAAALAAPQKPQPTSAAAEDGISEDDKIDRLRARQAALVERLLKADKSKNDAALRREIATVAAMMVELTASREGAGSRLHALLQGSEGQTLPGSKEPTLAARAHEMIAAGR